MEIILTNITKDCQKFLGYLPYNTLDNVLFNNRDFLVKMYKHYGIDCTDKMLETWYHSLHILVELLYPEEYKENVKRFKQHISNIYNGKIRE